jgi:hypothetical protein
MRRLGLFIALFCVATIAAQAIVLGFLLLSGRVGTSQWAQIGDILRGVEFVPSAALRVSDEPPWQPSLDEQRQSALLEQVALDTRLRALEQRQNLLGVQQRQLEQDMQRYQEAVAAFRRELDDWSTGQKGAALAASIELLGNLKPRQAKEQIVLMWKRNQRDWVVALLRALPPDQQAKIAAEFREPDEVQMLSEILDLWRAGQPDATMADAVGQQLGPAVP